MKSYEDFLYETPEGGQELIKLLKKRFKSLKPGRPNKHKGKGMKGNKIQSVVIPKSDGKQIRDFLKGIGYKVQEEFDGFIDMYAYDRNASRKVSIVCNDTTGDCEVRIITTLKGVSSNSFRKDTFSQQNAINQNKFSGKSPRYR